MVYIHIPWCRSFCTYCGFYSEIPRDDLGDFVSGLCDEILSRKDEILRSLAVDTVYIGGGTPSILSAEELGKIISTLRSIREDIGSEEFTVEVNPDDIVKKGATYAEGLRRLGVSRISMGVQSFDDGLLRWMNRRHNAEDAVTAFRILREAGFDNVSLDLIFGIGDFAGREFTEEMWVDTIDRTLTLAPEHISAYQLSVEPESALEKLCEKGRFTPAGDEKCARQYDALCRRLAEKGYHHYEISNFALPGREARHNSAYWHHTPYVGLGPGAHSLRLSEDGRWVRSWNYPGAGSEILSDEQIRMETIMLGLRTDRGVEPPLLGEKAAGPLGRGDLVPTADGLLRIPEDKFFISDAIISSLC